jgi:Skp family chaperone for outer membrane proteins
MVGAVMNYVGTPEPITPLRQAEFAADEALSKRQIARLLRDRERGYSINTKQIVLAFAVEFTIIGLILTNIYVTVAQLPDPSTFKTIQALLFPIAMAMVELARVPLAVAVRTQNSWNIKLAALLGVLCAVAVTSNSLYAIGATSFTPRLEETHRKDDALKDAQDERARKQSEIDAATESTTQKREDRDAQAQALQSLSEQLTKQPMQSCGPVTVPSALPGGAPTITTRCSANPVLKTLNAEIAATKVKIDQAQVALTQAENALRLKREELRPIAEANSRAAAQNRESVFQSQLHSLAAMLFRVDPEKVTPEQLKTLEFYLIFVSSIAAAFSSTLIAMTAVRRIKKPKEVAAVTIPDEAAAYLFGPLVIAIRKEAADAVAAAVSKVQRVS